MHANSGIATLPIPLTMRWAHRTLDTFAFADVLERNCEAQNSCVVQERYREDDELRFAPP
jgi:hypothetical protein